MVLHRNGGNRTRTARELGISRGKLSQLLDDDGNNSGGNLP
jgi:DNA-binding protein Fis